MGIFAPRKDLYHELANAQVTESTPFDPEHIDKLSRCVLCNYRTNAVFLCGGCSRVYCAKCHAALLKHSTNVLGHLHCILETCPYSKNPEDNETRYYNRVMQTIEGAVGGGSFLVTQRWVRENLADKKEYKESCILSGHFICPVAYFAPKVEFEFSLPDQKHVEVTQKRSSKLEHRNVEEGERKKKKAKTADVSTVENQETSETIPQDTTTSMAKDVVEDTTEAERNKDLVPKKGLKCSGLWVQKGAHAPFGGILVLITVPVKNRKPFNLETRLLFPNTHEDGYYANPAYKNLSEFKKTDYSDPRNLSILGKEGKDYMFISPSRLFSLKLVNQDYFTSNVD